MDKEYLFSEDLPHWFSLEEMEYNLHLHQKSLQFLQKLARENLN